MKRHKSSVVFILSLLLLKSQMVVASPDSLSYQGKIAKADGTPLEYSGVSFIFEITSHDGACVLFREQRSGINMANSKGVFDVPIGLGTRSFPTSGTYKFSDVFNNSISHACDGGGNYSPAVSAERRLRVQFWDGKGWQLISPDNVIRSVPFAVQATNTVKFADKSLSEFVLKSIIPSCDANEFLTWDGMNFTCLPGTAGSGSQLQGRAVSSAAPTSNQVLKWNGTAWAPANDEEGSGGGSGGVSSVDLSVPSIMSVSGGPVTSSGTLSVSLNAQSAATVFAAPAGASGVPSFRPLNISDIRSNLVAQGFLDITQVCSAGKALVYVSATDQISCQSISIGGTAGGDLDGSYPSPSVVKLQGRAISNVAPTNDQVLKWNGSAWAPAADQSNSGTVTSVNISVPSFMSVSGGPVTSSGTLAVAMNSQSAGLILASPAGAAGAPSFRSLASTDIPDLDVSKLISGVLPLDRGGTGSSTGSISGTGPLVFAAGGVNQNVTLTPSGTGYVILNNNVGIGVSAPVAKLEVSGEIKPGNTGSACSSATEGHQRYNQTSKVMEFCDGSNWLSMSGGGDSLEWY
ncbi:hypothetical protein [Bdellovibrio sp.]|uniref:hypothetical protein n=1 Tax=Bdellovibrio sp. TaxID=28201 RepID=UPI0039E4BF43